MEILRAINRRGLEGLGKVASMACQRIENPDQQGVQNEVGDNPFAEYYEDREPTEQENTMMREELNKAIARSVEFDIKYFTDISLGRFPAKIQNIIFFDEQLTIRISLPFNLLPASPEPGEHPYPLREQKRFRQGFAAYLRKTENQKQLSNFFGKQLVDFLVMSCTSKKFSSEIMKLLRSLPQRIRAGRPNTVVPAHASRQIKQEGKSVFRSIHGIRSEVGAMKKRNKDLTAGTLLLKLRRKYPASKYTWMPEFLAMANNLPRRRYEPSGSAELGSSKSADLRWKLRSCSLLEPENWGISEIVVRVIQAKLHRETGILYPLREIRPLIKSK